MQSEVAQTIARELHAVITPDEKHLIEKTPTANLTAYDFYQRGKEEEHVKYWINKNNNGILQKEVLQKAEDLYRKALNMIQLLLRHILVWQEYIGTSIIGKNISQKISWILF